MKILLSTILYFLIFFNCYSQNEIRGVGPFKIGYTINNIIDTIEKLTHIKAEHLDSWDFKIKMSKQYNKYNHATSMVLIKDTALPASNNLISNRLKKESDFSTNIYIDFLNIASIEIRDIDLTFYKDTLIEIKSTSAYELSKAFDIKYGKGKTSSVNNEITCRNAILGKYDLSEKSYLTRWKSKISNIEVTSIIGYYYDENCEKQYISNFSIVHKRLKEKMEIEKDKYANQKINKNNLNDL